MRLLSLLPAALLCICASMPAYGSSNGAISVGPSYARASMPGQKTGGAYLTLENRSTSPDALIAVETPAAGEVEMHVMSMQGNIMRMRQVAAIELAPGATLAMQPGKGYHLMLMGLKAPLKAGQTLPLILHFRHAGTVRAAVPVESAMAMAMPAKER